MKTLTPLPEPILIRGGQIADGTGAAMRRADVLITDGRISQVGPSICRTDPTTTVIDADGLIVCPGFIDLHSHTDYVVESEPAATGLLAQGVTSVVTGNCGWSPFPVENARVLREWSAFLGGSLSFDWEDFKEFADRVDASHPAIHVLPLVGHIPIRLAAVGGEQRAPSPAELQTMRRLVSREVDQGVWGLSSGLIYAPGSFADAEEIVSLATVAAQADALYSTHIRNETSDLLAAIDEAIGVARAAQRAGTRPRLQISHLKAMGSANRGLVPRALERIDAANASGLDIAADVYPYTASATTLASRLPEWALDGGSVELSGRLAHPDTRARIRDALALRFARGDFDASDIVLGGLQGGRFEAAQGSTLADLARMLDVHAEEAALTVLEASRGGVGIINHAMSEQDLRAALRHPLVAVASDGDSLEPTRSKSTHPRAFGTFSRIFAKYVREERLLPVEEAVRKCTLLPATRLGLCDRGVIAAGAVADIAVFNPVGIADLSSFSDPGRHAVGMEAVIVAGRIVWRKGRATGIRAGGVLRRRGAHAGAHGR